MQHKRSLVIKFPFRHILVIFYIQTRKYLETALSHHKTDIMIGFIARAAHRALRFKIYMGRYIVCMSKNHKNPKDKND